MRIDFARELKTGIAEKRRVLSQRPLLATNSKHPNVQGLMPAGLRIVRNNGFDYEHPGIRRGGGPHSSQDFRRVLVVPVMDHVHQQIRVTRWQIVRKEIASLKRESTRGRSGGMDHMRLIEKNPASVWRALEHRLQ